MLQVGKSASFTEFWMVKQKETVCGRVRVSEKREGSGEMFGLGCNPSAESWTKHTVHFCHTQKHSVVGRRKEDFGDHQLQPLHPPDEEQGPGEGDQDHTVGEKANGPTHISQVTHCTYKSIYNIHLAPLLNGLNLPLRQKLLDDQWPTDT